MTSRPATLGQLRDSGWVSVPVKEEMRRNAAAAIAAGRPGVAGVLGYDDTVLPQLEHALLAGHDIIFLGERGQAKTRMIRGLTGLLDEWLPIVAGSEILDDPYHPVSRHARDLVTERGEDAPVDWVHRETRFGEKLATPDTSIADLIGEVDPIKVAEGRYLSDELTMHYGWRSATSASAATRCGSPSTCSWGPAPTPRTTPTEAGSSPRSRTASGPRSAPTIPSTWRRRSRSFARRRWSSTWTASPSTSPTT